MNILAIDTSSQMLGVAILKDDEIIGEVVTNLVKDHSVRLMPAIDELMKEVNIVPEQLDKIAVAKGPGSYTGVRIGVTTAKSLAWALSIPVVGISSLEVLAYQARFFGAYICPFFDARREMVFTSLYKWEMNTLEPVYKDSNLLMTDWLTKLSRDKKEVLFLSPNINLYKKVIKDYLGESAVIPEGPYHLARPSHLALASMKMTADNLHTLTPNYLRLSEAEANWINTQKEVL